VQVAANEPARPAPLTGKPQPHAVSELSDIAADTIAERAPWTTDPIRNLRTGAMFLAEIDGSPEVILLAQTELGDDYRNVILLHVNSDADANNLNRGDKIQFQLFGATINGQVIKRRDSGAQVQTDFWVQQLTPKDQI